MLKALALLVSLCCLSALAAPLRFSQLQERRPELIWAKTITPELKASLEAYRGHKRLPDGVVYGSVIRALNLTPLCLGDIKNWAQAHSCTVENDVVKSPKDNQALHDSNGKTIRLVSYLCPDGGVIRVKPDGDPTQPKNPLPNAVKAMRYFGVNRYADFSDEAFKVDNAGLAIPKWPKDLNTDLPELRAEPRTKSDFVNEWAHDAHTQIKPCPCSDLLRSNSPKSLS